MTRLALRLALLLAWLPAAPAFAAQTTGGVTWLDSLAYRKPAFYPLTVPDEASVPNQYYVDQQSGSGTACSQASPCSWAGLSGKPGTTGGPAYIYLKGNARLNLTGTLYGSAGNEIVIKPWPGSTSVVTMTSAAGSNWANANIIQGANVHHLVMDGGQNLLFEFVGTSGSDQNNYTLVVSSNYVTIARTRIHAGAGSGPALGIGTGAGSYNHIGWINNEMYDSTHYYGVYTGGGVGCADGNTSHSDVYFYNNIFRDICGRGIQIEPRSAATNTYVSGNAFHDLGWGVACGVSISHAVEPAGACGATINGVYVDNNLAFNLYGGFGQVGEGSNEYWRNNTIYRYGIQTPVTLGSHAFSAYADGNPGTVQNNIILAPVSGGINPINRSSGFTTSKNLCESGAACGSSALSGTPATVFVSTSTSSADYLLPAGTGPAINAGNNYYSAGLTTDYLAAARPSSAAFEVGAIEYATGGDTTPPSLTSLAVASDGATIALGFSETVNANSAIPTLASNAGVAVTLAAPSGNGSTTLTWTLSRQVLNSEIVTASYAQPGNGIEDIAGNDLPSFSSQPVTNSSVQTLVALSNLLPVGALPKTTTSASLQATTSKNAACRYSTAANAAYAAMTPYSATGGTSHSQSVPVKAGVAYRYCSTCLDSAALQESAQSCTYFNVLPRPKRRVW